MKMTEVVFDVCKSHNKLVLRIPYKNNDYRCLTDIVGDNVNIIFAGVSEFSAVINSVGVIDTTDDTMSVFIDFER